MRSQRRRTSPPGGTSRAPRVTCGRVTCPRAACKTVERLPEPGSEHPDHPVTSSPTTGGARAPSEVAYMGWFLRPGIAGLGFVSLPVIAGFASALGFTGALVLGTTDRAPRPAPGLRRGGGGGPRRNRRGLDRRRVAARDRHHPARTAARGDDRPRHRRRTARHAHREQRDEPVVCPVLPAAATPGAAHRCGTGRGGAARRRRGRRLFISGVESIRGRHFAIDTSGPRHGRFQITGSAYEALREEDRQVAFAAPALFAAVGGGLTLVFAKLGPSAGRP